MLHHWKSGASRWEGDLRRTELSIGVVVLLGCVAACDSGPGESPREFEIDALPVLRLEERTVLGGSTAEGPDAFGSVTSVALLTDQGALAVADGTVQEISLFNLSGMYLGKTGGRGGGPGEFRAIRQMGTSRSGRLHVWDIVQSRATTLALDLKVVGTNRADLDPVRDITPEFVGFLPDGRFVLRDVRSGMGMGDLPEGMRQDSVWLYLYSSTGQFADTLAVLREEPKWFRNRNRLWGKEDPIFGRELVTLVVDDEVWVGSTGEFSFTRYGLDGQVRGEVDLGTHRRPASQKEIEDERARRIGEVGVRSGVTVIADGADLLSVAAEAEREAIRELPSYETLPAYDVAVVGSDGVVLLREYPGPLDADTRWVVLDKGGVPRGTLSLPRATEIKAASAETLAVLERDEFDAPILRILQLGFGSGTAS